MSMLPGFALPEDLLCVSPDAEAGLPIDAITCALDRADSVLMLLEDHLDGDKPLLSNHVLSSVIWDVRGTLGLIKHSPCTVMPLLCRWARKAVRCDPFQHAWTLRVLPCQR